MAFDPEQWRLGAIPVTGTEIYPGAGAKPAQKPAIESFLPQFDRTNRDAFLQAFNTLKTGATGAGYSQSDVDQYINTNLAPEWNDVQRGYYTDQGKSLIRGALQSRLGDRYNEYGNDIEDELTRYAYSIRPDVTNASGQDIVNIPQTHFGGNVSSNIIGALNDRVRGRAMSMFNSTFKASPYQEIDDTTDDPYISKIVDEQYGTAKEGIDRQFKRGALNDFGRNKAYKNLDTQKGVVSSRLQDRGKSLLDTLRQRAQGIYDSAQKSASGANIDSPFNVDNFSSQYRSAIESGKAGLEGSLRDMVSPDEFNTQNILGNAYSAQGPTNRNGAILAALEARNKTRSNNRGLGTVGAF